MTINRNNKCPCGSGLKYKKCCKAKTNGAMPTFPENNETDFKLLVELKPSPTHGLGVFATQNIPPFTKLCLYDGEDLPNDKIDNESVYLMPHPIKEGYTRQGYTKEYIRTPYGIGQFINDSCKPEIDVKRAYTYRELENIYEKYFLTSKQNKNVAYKDDDFWLYSIKPILKGEELFCFYGPNYWLEDPNVVKNLKIRERYRYNYLTKTVKRIE